MNSSIVPQRRSRRLRLVISILAISLVALAALIVPHVVHTAQAAAPKPATMCAQIPSGADPTTFTSQQLKQYGLPPQFPGQSHARWMSMVRHARNHFCFPHTTASPSAAQHGLMQPLIAHDIPSCGICFAGLEGDDTTSDPMTLVYSSVVVSCTDPSFVNAQDPIGSAVNAWVGFGSPGGTGPFLRVGLAVRESSFIVSTPGGPIQVPVTFYQSYIQDTSDPTNIQMGPYFDCGETVDLEIYSPSGDPTDHQWNVSFFGETSGNYFNFTKTSYPDTSAAACMVEDPNNGTQELFLFGTISFTNCVANNGNTEPSGLLFYTPHQQWTMTTADEDPVVWVTNIRGAGSLGNPGDGAYFDVDSAGCDGANCF